jgi:pimeloyl-ACP methyl ester carboxylesterase
MAPLLVVTIIALLGAAFTAPLHGAANKSPVGSAANASPVSGATACKKLQFNVTLTPTAVTRYPVIGWLCSKPGLIGRTVQVLLPGSSLSHLYWDFPFRPQQYSYVHALTNAGYATLNLDRLGSGASGLPPGGLVTVDTSAYVVHQIVHSLHSGRASQSAFGKVILVGYSTGSAVAVMEASRYADVNGVILTGLFHTFAPSAAVFGTLSSPAAADHKFAHRALPAGYETTLPGTLAAGSLYTPNADSSVIKLMEAEKDIAPSGEDAGFASVVTTPAIVQNISVPILSVVGQHDAYFCTAPSCPEAQSEPAAYDCRRQGAGVLGIAATVCAPAAEVELVVYPNAGHALNLQRNAPGWFAIARRWLDRHFGPCPLGCHAKAVG